MAPCVSSLLTERDASKLERFLGEAQRATSDRGGEGARR
jgi:hypothetical protein